MFMSYAGLTKLEGDYNQRFVTSVRSQENTDYLAKSLSWNNKVKRGSGKVL
ncbi:hypothetical protein OAF38_00770 [bacterium]|nr:hypothetical protein [bacterium]